MAVVDRQCTLLLNFESAVSKEGELQERLESKNEEDKIEGLKLIICHLLNGESLPKLLMPVIKYCLHAENHLIKKLLLLYWEIVDKKNKDGTLLHEMILVCNAMKNNLNHPNEYIRGSTLRFLCKMKEAEILESLIPSVTANLEHRHSYVRKNAVITVFTIYEAFQDLIPDAPELIEQFLYAEANPAAKRNAFLMLFHIDQDKAVTYLNSVIPTLGSLGESFQLVVLELIRKVCRTNPLAKSQYIRCIFGLVNAPSHAVAFEGANTLVALTSAPTAVRAAVTAYTTLLQNESDNNIKLIILQRLSALKKRNEKILQEMLMDILRTLSSPSIDIRRKTLDLALDLVSPRNVEEVVQLLKKELVKTENPEYGRSDAYRKLLVDAMHQCAVKFPDVVSTVVHLLMNYLGDENASSALDVIFFVREIVEEYPQLRDQILAKVIENFDEIRSSEVYRVTLWILGEYAIEPAILDLTLLTIRTSVGPLPLLSPKTAEEEEADKKAAESKDEQKRGHVHDVKKAAGPVVLADGTYAQQSSVQATPAVPDTTKRPLSVTNLRTLLLNGDYFLASSLANTMTKLLLRFTSIAGIGSRESNEEIAKGLLMLVSILRLGNASHSVKVIDQDSQQRIMMCIRILLEPKLGAEAFLNKSREVFAIMLEEQRKRLGLSKGGQSSSSSSGIPATPRSKETIQQVEIVKQVDDLISIRQLRGRTAHDDELLDDDEADLSRAVGWKNKNKADASKLNRVYQLTGFSDPVYAEAHLTVLEYDIVLDILVVNQTNSILQNLQVELHTSGDLKVVERPTMFTIPPLGIQKIHANIKVTSTESGVIFGNIVYDAAAGTQKSIVVLNNIHMDIMDYINPASCSDVAFRSMWAEFEWENKVAVNTDIADLNDYLNHVVSITNMRCMTPQANMSGSCQFLAANLYARSMFGEDALLNLSVEKQRNGKIGGYIRIRSKTQGIALSLGDKITAKQRGVKV